jgi:hypothetical protein
VRLLKDYEPLLKAIFLSISESSELRSDPPLDQILKNPKLIVAINHATAISWLPAISFLTAKVVESGGGDRTPIGIVDRFFFSNPLTLPLAEFLTQSKTPRGFDELLKEFGQREQMDLVVFPEGARTFFGDLKQIQTFRSPRFIELSIRAQVPLMLVVHRGSEDWNLNLALPPEWGALLMPFSSFFGKGLLEFGGLNLPFRLQKIKNFKMKTALYSPALYESDLSENPNERRMQLEQEAENVRQLMQEMWESLT